jgi:hypothetical protein
MLIENDDYSVDQTLEVLDYDKDKNLVVLRWTETFDNPKG